MPMRVAFLAAECEPWAKTGGLADVVDALARALGRLDGDAIGTPVDVFLPRYRAVPDPVTVESATVLEVPDPRSPSGHSPVTVIDVPAGGYRLRLIDYPAAFDREGFYGDATGDYADNAWRFGLFCRAALEALRADDRPLDLLHLHDWHTGPAAIFRDGRYADDPVIGRAAILMTLHNLAYHGWTTRSSLPQLGLAPGDGIVPAGADGIDLLRAGIERAELVNTVSPGFAAEALTPAFGMGLDGTLREMGDRFVGILNGLDNAVWDPSADPDLAAPYSRANLAGKSTCRADLLTRVGFVSADPGPVIGMIGRLDPQKGFDLLSDAAPALLERGIRLIVQGSGDPALAGPFRALAAANPERVSLIERFDRAMARRIYAGADFFVMPSRFEPCGQGQMIALRYGTPPIVHRTGGLADTVIDETTSPGHGTGFSFQGATVDGLVGACETAVGLHRHGGPAWAGLLGRGMAVDFDWTTGSAPRYLDAYRRAIAIRARRRSAEDV
ncbi:MAG: glycogen/starch synthase [Candidatus Limnocylindrales bacterium]|nr:glycogen/starch synthase [Candidatus Limnocylindrales bacterium]